MRARGLLCGILLSVSAGQTLSAVTPLDRRHTPAAAIDRALLMSEFLTLGIGIGLENALGERDGAAAIASCARTRINPAIKQAVFAMFEDLLSPEELKAGGRRAEKPVFARLARYIRENREALLIEAEANNPPRIDHYLLVIAAERLQVSEAERDAVRAFLAWHQPLIPRIDDRFAVLNAALVETAKSAVTACSS